MRTSWAFASWACSALLLAGCGGGPGLVAIEVGAGDGLVDVPDRRTGGSIDPVPTWRVSGNREVSFTVRLRNDGDEHVRVTGVRRDPDGDDQQFEPQRMDEPLDLPPGAEGSVIVRGRSVSCGSAYGGQVTGKNGQTFVLGGGDTRHVDFEALIEFTCR